MRNKTVVLIGLCAVLAGCAIPGFGPYASGVVERFIGTKFTNPIEPDVNPTHQTYYSKVPQGHPWFYRIEKEGSGKRYYIWYYVDKDRDGCLYSLYVDENDIIRSWRDEGGRDHMSKCLLH